jgi:hypothetical protein
VNLKVNFKLPQNSSDVRVTFMLGTFVAEWKFCQLGSTNRLTRFRGAGFVPVRYSDLYKQARRDVLGNQDG